MPNRKPLIEKYSPTHKKPADDAAYWFDRAEEIRTIAEGMRIPETRVLMLDLAGTYKKLAERALERAKVPED